MNNVENITQQNKDDIYCDLFRMVKNELALQGQALQMNEQEYELFAGGFAKAVPVNSFIHLKGGAFYESLHFYCFQNLPSEQAKKDAEQMSQKTILKMLANQSAFSVRGLYYIDNPFGTIKPGIKGNLMKTASGVKNSVALRKIAKKLPKGIQDKIRGTFV